MTEQWLSIVEYARTLSVSDLTVRRRIKTGRLPAVLREGKYYIPVNVDQNGHVVTRNGRSVPIQHESTAASVPEKPTAMPSPNTSWAGLRSNPSNRVAGAAGHVIPHTIRRPIEVAADHNSSSSVDGNALIEFCESAMARFATLESRVESEAAARIQSLESQFHAANVENKTLRQQVEDLQVLVKILEKRGK